MTTKTESPTEKARRITEDQIEAIGFDLSRNAQQTVASIEERHDLLRRRECGAGDRRGFVRQLRCAAVRARHASRTIRRCSASASR